jgi:nitrite reductase/ring-hydroxylating ferredoxin subunit
MERVLCQLAEIDPDTGKEVFLGGPEAPVSVALLRAGESVVAYHNVCPHMGRPLSLGPDEFILGKTGELVCPHHGACFDVATGECVSGPCTGDFLRPIAIELRDGQVLLQAQEFRKPG